MQGRDAYARCSRFLDRGSRKCTPAVPMQVYGVVGVDGEHSLGCSDT